MRSFTSFEPATLSFSGHETFRFRYPWLPKAVQGVLDDPDLFSREDAMVKLGVGKNMVRSMRHWCLALGLMDRHSSDGLTELGKRLFSSDGWDPFLEDTGTLWLLHWQLVASPERASTWHYAFTRWAPETFTREQLSAWLAEVAERAGDRTSRETIKRDVDVFVQTYVPSEPSLTVALEETFDCPMVELGLIRELDKKTYAFTRGRQPTLPDEVFVYALLRYWTVAAPERQTLDIGRIAHGPGSPGAAFKLTPNALVERFENLPAWAGLAYDETAGVKQILRTGCGIADPMGALEIYYRGVRG
ncbi:hypothetical protein Mterra_00618 [Calidithermus terrae]|uniref:DUF4007 domain-containing protein n=1 Tax=Calidithermus terrae TaxID=1408545 RepID=A0A399F2D5_9DEIN|nr:DUF4007 family protein [Calidithermus terrae]RIH90243.1 hypothetical protein Mterra_00618 [Calidithermus terrae]